VTTGVWVYSINMSEHCYSEVQHLVNIMQVVICIRQEFSSPELYVFVIQSAHCTTCSLSSWCIQWQL